jgi:hypothetical protein
MDYLVKNLEDTMLNQKNGGYVLLNALERGCGAEGTDA